jgi:hypothetical protein
MANAQNAATASLGIPDTDAFPQIETYLDVHDADGKFVHNLKIEDVSVLEDDAPAQVISLRELRQGVQVVVALNPGPELGVRNSQAISRYDLVKDALRDWTIRRQGSTLDDWSLIITNGPEISHVSDPLEMLEILEADPSDARTAEPSLDTLFQAISVAADPPVRSGMGRAVLFVTPPPSPESLSSLENIFTQARDQDVSVVVWMVASSGALGTQGAQRLMELTESAGGQIFTFTGDEALPDPEIYMEPLRSIYQLTYKSNVSTSGTHQFIAQVQIDGVPVSTEPLSFEIDIQPPIPTFVTPPIQIVRAPDPEAESSGEGESSTSNLLPNEQPVQVVFDFPDGRLRSIVSSALYVDGVLVDENQEPPFDQFIWDLGNYTTDGMHQLQVQATDSLGLTGSSVEIPVNIRIELPSENPWVSIQQNMPLLVGLIVLVSGAILILVLLLGGRLKPRTPGTLKKRRRKSDPVTQPLPTKENHTRRLPTWVNRLQWSQKSTEPQPFAFLSRISEKDNLAIEPPIPITSGQVRIGKDPDRADLVLDHPSIERLHARLTRADDGAFRLADEGTIAGTWINYTPVSIGGSKLEHGDLVHIGRLGFRFTLREPQQIRKPVITLISPPDENREEAPS